MTSYTQTTTRRLLPRGWLHLLAQFAFWIGFYVMYQVVRGIADRDVGAAFWNGIHVIRIEHWSGTLFEPAAKHPLQAARHRTRKRTQSLARNNPVASGIAHSGTNRRRGGPFGLLGMGSYGPYAMFRVSPFATGDAIAGPQGATSHAAPVTRVQAWA